MASHETSKRQRSHLGYGSSYRKGRDEDLKKGREIGAVLGGRVWMVEPDERPQASNPCIWMQSGAVENKYCNNFYDCTRCKYDLGMRKRVESGKQLSWQDAMRKRPGLDRICRHSLTNRIEKRACAYNYECSKCDFDQFFEDVWAMKTHAVPQDVRLIKGFKVPNGYYFHNGHTWAQVESGGYMRIGMDDFALKLLGKAETLDLPLMGKELDRNTVGWGLKRHGNHADFLSPVDGVILEVNAGVRENPELARREPYGQGWLFMIRTPDMKDTLKELMEDDTSMAWMSAEVGKLEDMVEKIAGPLAADGGYLADDIYGNLPALGWKRLTKTFLKT